MKITNKFGLPQPFVDFIKTTSIAEEMLIYQ